MAVQLKYELEMRNWTNWKKRNFIFTCLFSCNAIKSVGQKFTKKIDCVLKSIVWDTLLLFLWWKIIFNEYWTGQIISTLAFVFLLIFMSYLYSANVFLVKANLGLCLWIAQYYKVDLRIDTIHRYILTIDLWSMIVAHVKWLWFRRLKISSTQKERIWKYSKDAWNYERCKNSDFTQHCIKSSKFKW